MLYGEIIAVCSEFVTEHVNTLCGQNGEFANVKHGGTCSNHWAVEGEMTCFVCMLRLIRGMAGRYAFVLARSA
jgi:hypothetical protein